MALDEVRGPVPAGGEEHVRLNAIHGAISALNAVPDEVIRAGWLQRLAGLLTPSREGAQPSTDVHERMRAARRWQGVTGGIVRRVIPGPDVRRRGLRIMSVELYDQIVAVQWHFTSYDESWPRTEPPGPTVDLADDLGTEYVGRGGGGTRMDNPPGWPAVVRGIEVFVPAVPPSAERLRVVYEGQAIEIQLH